MNKEQKKAIEQYIQSKFSIYISNKPEFMWNNNEVSVKIEHRLASLGIYMLALKECRIVTKLYGDKFPILGNLRLSYEHIDGSTNGCTLGMRIELNDNDTVTEVQK